MADGRVGTFRMAIHWGAVEPRPGARNWGGYDKLVKRAARRGISVLAALQSSPRFIDSQPREAPTSSSGRAAYARFTAAAVRRYGPGGAFWRANPDVPARPIRRWQLWNEPNGSRISCRTRRNCPPHVSPANYRKLVMAAHRAMNGVDSGATIGLAGMAETKRGVSIASYLRQLYSVRSFKGYFDAVSLHPYAADHRGVEGAVVRTRRLMRSKGDPRTRIWLTEVGWGTAGRRGHFAVTTKSGQRSRLRKTFDLVVRTRQRYRVGLLVWFSLQDRPPTSAERQGGHWQPHTGLFTKGGSPKPAWKAYVSFTGGRATGGIPPYRPG